MLAAVRTASRDDAAMHRAVIAVAAGTAVAMLAVRQRAIRNAIASALTVRAPRDARRRRGTTRDRAREGRGARREGVGAWMRARASRGSEVMDAEAMRFAATRASRGTGVGGARGRGARGARAARAGRRDRTRSRLAR